MSARILGDLAGWVVRRAGLARVTVFATATGFALPALAEARPLVGVMGLCLALLGSLAALPTCRRQDGRRGGWAFVLVASVVLVGLLGGYLVGSLRVLAILHTNLEQLIGKRVATELVITGQVRSNAGWQSATAVVASSSGVPAGQDKAPQVPAGVFPVPAGAQGEPVLLEVPPAEGTPAVALSQGSIVAFRGTIRAPEGRSASGFDQASYLRHQGIRVVFQAGDAKGVTLLGRRGGISGWFDRLRLSARDHLSKGPDLRVDEVVKGVVLGDTDGIDGGWLEAFRRSGTAHMLSPGGLHVASIAALMIALARLLKASRGVGFMMAAGAALLMLPFVGASPPMIRAAVMIVVVLIGSWVGRRKDHWQVLALAALVVLALNPFAISDVGFQLSFAAFAGMLALIGPLQRLFGRLPKAIAANLAVSVAATFGTAPVSLLVFGRTSIVAPLTNLLVVPLLPLITGLGMASAFVGFIWAGLSSALDTLVSLPMVWTIEVSRVMAVGPVLDSSDLGPIIAALVVAAFTTPAALALMGRPVKTPLGIRLPLFSRFTCWFRARRPRSRALAALLGAAVVVAGLALGFTAYSPMARGVETVASYAPGKGWPAQLEVRVLDVGQGNAILVRTPSHRALLFDGGPAGCSLARQLHALGVRKLDVVVVSHPHADHFAGLLEAVDQVEISTLVDQTAVVPRAPPAQSSSNPRSGSGGNDDEGSGSGSREALDYLRLLNVVVARGGRHIQASAGSSIEAGGVTIRFFPPTRPVTLVAGAEPWAGRAAPPSGDELNASSLVSVVSCGNIDVVLPGDAEAEVLQARKLPPGDILVVPHHGSRASVTARLVKELGIKAACISVGEGNSFGHPDPYTLSLLKDAGIRVLRTDKDGWVSFRISGDQVAAATQRKPSK